MNVGIYKITHRDTGRVYIGQSSNLSRRKSAYAGSGGGGNTNSVIKRSILKYGWDAFDFDVIVYCEHNMLNVYEKGLIALYDCRTPNGFNVQAGGGDYSVSDETKELISRANSGRVRSDEVKKKLSNAQVKRWKSVPATEAQIENARCLGYQKPSDEVRAKMSEALRQRGKVDPASFANFKGKKHTPETREKMRQSHLKRNEEKRRSHNG